VRGAAGRNLPETRVVTLTLSGKRDAWHLPSPWRDLEIGLAFRPADRRLWQTREEIPTSQALARLVLPTTDGSVRRRRLALAVSLTAHGLALLALVVLLAHIAVPTPPAEQSVAMVFEPAPALTDASAPTPAQPAIAEPAPAKSPPAVEPPPVAAAVEPPPVEAPPPPPAAEAEPAVQPEPPPVATEPPKPRRVVAPTRPTHAARPVTTPSPATDQPTAIAPTAVALTAAPLLPAHPVAGMESDRPPVYPEIARRRGQQGRVTLQVNVSADGKPLAVSVAESSGHASLDDAARAAVQQWRFVPASRGGTPIPALAEVPVRFRLSD